MQTPKKGMRKELFYKTPDGEMTYEQFKNYKPVGDLKTKKAGMLKTSADESKTLAGGRVKPTKDQAREELVDYAYKQNLKDMKRAGGPLKSAISSAKDKVVHSLNKATMKKKSGDKKKGLKGLIQRAMTKGQLATRDVDGKPQMVREKSKTVTRKDGTVKKTVVKGKGTMGSNIGRYKDVKRYK